MLEAMEVKDEDEWDEVGKLENEEWLAEAAEEKGGTEEDSSEAEENNEEEEDEEKEGVEGARGGG